MLKKTCVKWALLLAGSTVAALNVGSCIAEYLFQYVILRAVN